jgi:flagellar biosynthesis protein FlhG
MSSLSDGCRAAFLSELRELDTACDLIVIDTGAGVENNVMAFLCAVNEIVILTTPEPTAIANAYATIKVVSHENPGVRLMLVVNMVKSSSEGTLVAERLSSITRQFLNLEVEHIGSIPIDPAVPNAVRLRTPFVSQSPGCAAAAGINQIIRKLGYGQANSTALDGADGLVIRMQRFFRARNSCR